MAKKEGMYLPHIWYKLVWHSATVLIPVLAILSAAPLKVALTSMHEDDEEPYGIPMRDRW